MTQFISLHSHCLLSISESSAFQFFYVPLLFSLESVLLFSFSNCAFLTSPLDGFLYKLSLRQPKPHPSFPLPNPSIHPSPCCQFLTSNQLFRSGSRQCPHCLRKLPKYSCINCRRPGAHDVLLITYKRQTKSI